MREDISATDRWKPMLRSGTILMLTLGIFILDTLTNLEIAAAVFYIIVILLAVGRLKRPNVIVLATACSALTLLSAFLTAEGSREAGLINMGISVSAIVITTYLALKMVAAEAAVHEARAQMVRIARVTSLGELTTSIAHEVNQPLTGVVTSGNACLRWLSQSPPNIDNARRSVERIIGDANRASEIIQRVRSLARSEAPKREPIDVNESVAEAIALTRSEIERSGIALRLNLADALPPVGADGIQFQQVIGNLLLNAIEAMSEVPQSRRSLEIVSTIDSAGMVTVSVADSGPGLLGTAQDHLFEAFWTTKERGTGIGLTISRSIVEAHGGRIWPSENVPAGAIFHVSLPAWGERI
ncbi:MAG: two-component sensor histidine kinase [Caulobacter sp. 32-67-35]|nr:MAG: two-component sensor histidine kinase [Caulobacter sp. 32-67-35]